MKTAPPQQKSLLVAWLRNAAAIFAGTLLASLVVWYLAEVRVTLAVERYQAQVKKQLDADLKRMEKEFKF